MSRTSKPRRLRVAMVKAESRWGDVATNLDLFESLALRHVDDDLDVLVTPECFLDGYMVRDRERCTRRKLMARCVRGVNDPAILRVGRIAAKLKSHVVFGASERDGAGTLRNAAYLIGRDGAVVGTYYKIHACEFYRPGDALPVFATGFGAVGILICADRRWPENARVLRLEGAEIILNPTWGFYGDLNTAIMRARAYENGIPICFAHPKQALIYGPKGDLAAVLESNRPSVLTHELDLAENGTPRATADLASGHPIQFRRPDLYGRLTACSGPALAPVAVE